MLVLDHGGTDGDGQIHVALKAQIADGAGVDAPLEWLQFVNDFHRPNLGGAGDGARREGGLQDIQRIQPVLQFAFDVGHNMHHMRITLDDHVFGELDGTHLGDAAAVVATEVKQLRMFGALFLIGQQLSRQCGILFRRGAAFAGAGDRPDGNAIAFQSHENFRRSADDMKVFEIEVEHVGRGVQAAQGAIERHRIGLERLGHALREHDLHHIAFSDVALGPEHRVLECRFADQRNRRF